MQQFIATGNVGKEPEVRRLESGKAVAKFSLATTKKWRDKDGNSQEAVTWHNCVVWDKLAEIAEKWVKKGQHLFIKGEVSYREYTGSDNVKKYFTEIVVSEFEMLGGKRDGDASQPAASSQPDSGAGVMGDVGEPPATDDLPF